MINSGTKEDHNKNVDFDFFTGITDTGDADEMVVKEVGRLKAMSGIV